MRDRVRESLRHVRGERLDVYNGILLAPHLDAAFDRGGASISRRAPEPH